MNKKITVASLITLLSVVTSVIAKDGYYSIGNHREMYLECKGSGAPVVLLIAGYADRGDASWNLPLHNHKSITVFSEISKLTKTCFYDRPGTIIVRGNSFQMSRSTPVKQPVNVKQQVDDLHALIGAAQITKPFIMVAHSAGGFIARMYAYTYPGEISGLMLLDVTTEDLKDKWTRNEWAIFDYSMNTILDPELAQHPDFEWLNMDVSFYQMQEAMGVGDRRVKLNIPYTVVMTADQLPNVKGLIDDGRWPGWATQKMANDIVKKIHLSQEELANSFNPPAKHITKTNSGHKIQAEQPQMVIDEIIKMIDQVRKENNQDKQ